MVCCNPPGYSGEVSGKGEALDTVVKKRLLRRGEIVEDPLPGVILHLRLLAADRDLIDQAASAAQLPRSAWAAAALEHVLQHGMHVVAPPSRSQNFDVSITLRLAPTLLSRIDAVRGLSYLRVWVRVALVNIAREIQQGTNKSGEMSP